MSKLLFLGIVVGLVFQVSSASAKEVRLKCASEDENNEPTFTLDSKPSKCTSVKLSGLSVGADRVAECALVTDDMISFKYVSRRTIVGGSNVENRISVEISRVDGSFSNYEDLVVDGRTRSSNSSRGRCQLLETGNAF